AAGQSVAPSRAPCRSDAVPRRRRPRGPCWAAPDTRPKESGRPRPALSSFRQRREGAPAHRAAPRGGTRPAGWAVGRGRLVHGIGGQRIEDIDAGEPREVMIGRPQLPNTVKLADGGDAGVVDEWTDRTRDPGRAS